MSMKLCLALSLVSLGCAAETAAHPPASAPGGHASPPHDSPPPIPKPTGRLLAPVALEGPFATLEKACQAGASQAGSPFHAGSPCAATPITVTPDLAFQAALLHAKDTKSNVTASSGVFLLAIGRDSAWFSAKKPLDQMSGAAGQTYLPAVTLVEALSVEGRLVLHLRDTVSSICNTCDASEQNKPKHVKTTEMVVACKYEPRGRPLCSEPIEVPEKTRVAVQGGVITITPPSGKTDVVSF